MITLTGAIILPVAVALWILGYLIAVRKRVNLIAGFDPERTTDPDEYALWIGTSAFLCGAGLLVTWALIAVGIVSPERLLTGVVVSAGASLVVVFFANVRCISR